MNPADSLLKEESSLIGPYLFLTASTPKRSGTSRSLRTVAERAHCYLRGSARVMVSIFTHVKKVGNLFEERREGREGRREEGGEGTLS